MPHRDPEEEIEDLAQRLERLPSKLMIEMDAAAIVMVIAQLQLALRHPGNQGPSRKDVIRFARGLQDLLASYDPEIGRYMERGWHECFVPTPERNFPP